ncbi:hypothetical protein ACFLTY_02730 [Chloroflexota bacterium]
MAETESPRKAKKRGLIKGIVILVVILGLLGAGVWWWFAPDLPPGGPAKALASGIGSLFSGDEAEDDIKLTPQEQQAVEQMLRDMGLDITRRQPTPREQKAEKIEAQLETAGIPVSGVFITETYSGDPVLGAALNFDELLEKYGTQQSLD